MNKKLMAVAVAGALAAPAVAFAQTSSVQIYGRANVGVDQWEAKGATNGSNFDYKARTRVFDSGSRLGFRGTEDLGNGLKALFVIESGVNIDTGSGNGQSGAANASTGTLASRDSYAGLGGNWGDVRFGRQSVYWVSGPNGQTGANYVEQEIGWYNGAGMGRVAGPSARTSNVMSYNSPTWSGANFSVYYAPQSEAAVGGANANGSLWGFTGRYEGPILGLQYDHAENQLAAPVAAGNRQKLVGDKFSLGWPYQPGARIALMYVQDQMKDANAQTDFAKAGDGIKQTHWGLNWEHMMGNWQFLAMYSQLQKAKGCNAKITTLTGHIGDDGCNGTDAKGYMVGVKYYFSKRTSVYANYIEHKNEWNQIADVAGGGISSGGAGGIPATSAGADPKIFGVGVWHSF